MDPAHPAANDPRRSTLAAPPVYRVIHHERNAQRDLGELAGAAAHPSTLDPFVSALLREGRGGRLALVDAASGITVARRVVTHRRPYTAPPPPPRRWGPRRSLAR